MKNGGGFVSRQVLYRHFESNTNRVEQTDFIVRANWYERNATGVVQIVTIWRDCRMVRSIHARYGLAHMDYSGNIPCRSPGRPPSAVAFTSPSAKRNRIRVPGLTPAACVIGVPDGSVTKA